MRLLPLAIGSISVFARTSILPLPVLYACLIPAVPIMVAPVGKSGPGRYAISSSMDMSLLSMRATYASMTSPRLWGGTFVAMPTAMPLLPFTSRLGKRLGSTVGCTSVSSKLGMKSTVFLSISASISRLIFERRASV